jgi:hypothetical protein
MMPQPLPVFSAFSAPSSPPVVARTGVIIGRRRAAACRLLAGEEEVAATPPAAAPARDRLGGRLASAGAACAPREAAGPHPTARPSIAIFELLGPSERG